MKNRQAIHVKKNDMVVFTNQTSGKRSTYKVGDVHYKPDEFPQLPVRLIIVTEYNERGKAVASAIVGYRENEQVLVA